jgi:2-hydroxy-6-oxonona-2,4-dienedioate hydrolase
VVESNQEQHPSGISKEKQEEEMFQKELDSIASFEKYYVAGGVRTRCFEKGEGDPVIFLHGGGGHAETWVRNIIPISKQFRVLAIDYLGHGYTDKPKVPYNVETFSKHLIDFMDAAGLERAHLVGESQGGQISVYTAYEHPERVDKLGLIVGGIPSNEHGHVTGQNRLQELSQAATDAPTKESIRKRMEWLFYDPKMVPDELVEIRLKIYSQPEFREHTMKGAGRKIYHLIEKIPKLRCPILFFWTTHNPTCPWPVAEKVHQAVPGSRFVLLDHAAHWPQFERPDEFNRVLTEFLLCEPGEVLIDTYRKRYW